MTLRSRPGSIFDSVVGRSGARWRSVPFLLAVSCLAAVISACGGRGNQDLPGGSCAPFDVQAGEAATYQFADAATDPTVVRIAIIAVSGTVVTMQIEQGSAVTRLDYDTRCTTGANANLALSAEVSHLLFGTLLLPAGASGTQPESVVSTRCGSANSTTVAGTFAVERCQYDYAAGGTIQNSEIDALPGGQSRPLTFGVIRESFSYSDGSRRGVELIEWNGY